MRRLPPAVIQIIAGQPQSMTPAHILSGIILHAVARDFCAIESRSTNHPGAVIDDPALTFVGRDIRHRIAHLLVEGPAGQQVLARSHLHAFLGTTLLDICRR